MSISIHRPKAPPLRSPEDWARRARFHKPVKASWPLRCSSCCLRCVSNRRRRRETSNSTAVMTAMAATEMPRIHRSWRIRVEALRASCLAFSSRACRKAFLQLTLLDHELLQGVLFELFSGLAGRVCVRRDRRPAPPGAARLCPEFIEFAQPWKLQVEVVP